ncbi:hypothetical protein BS17DRAFT_148201 [Gyrodon lividus]|nr:hypothetical protein BS17DRAFT_148201 [Gyrodon lividus]
MCSWKPVTHLAYAAPILSVTVLAYSMTCMTARPCDQTATRAVTSRKISTHVDSVLSLLSKLNCRKSTVSCILGVALSLLTAVRHEPWFGPPRSATH